MLPPFLLQLMNHLMLNGCLIYYSVSLVIHSFPLSGVSYNVRSGGVNRSPSFTDSRSSSLRSSIVKRTHQIHHQSQNHKKSSRFSALKKILNPWRWNSKQSDSNSVTSKSKEKLNKIGNGKKAAAVAENSDEGAKSSDSEGSKVNSNNKKPQNVHLSPKKIEAVIADAGGRTVDRNSLILDTKKKGRTLKNKISIT